MIIKPENSMFLITGGAGFIGRHLTHQLLRLGCRVRILDNFSASANSKLPEGVEIFKADANREESVGAAANGVDGIFHLAAIPSVTIGEKEPLTNQRSGEVALLATLQATLQTPSVQRIVFSSSAAVYGEPRMIPICENHQTEPISNYGVSKLACEHYLHACCASQSRLDAASLRFFNVYGPGQRSDSSYAGVITCFLEYIKKGEPPTIFGTGEQTRDFIWVEDVVDACIRTMFRPGRLAGVAINVATGIPSTVNQVWDTLSEFAGKDLEAIRKPRRGGEISNSLADVTLAQSLLGFTARTSLRTGISKLIDSLQQSKR